MPQKPLDASAAVLYIYPASKRFILFGTSIKRRPSTLFFFWHYSNVFHIRLSCDVYYLLLFAVYLLYPLHTVDIYYYIVRSSAAVWFVAVHGFGPLLYLCIRTFFTASIQLRVCIIMIRLLFWLPNIKNREQKKRFDSSPSSVFCCCVCIERYTHTTHTQRWWRMVTWGRQSWAKMPTVRDDNLLDFLVSTWTSRGFFLSSYNKVAAFRFVFFVCCLSGNRPRLFYFAWGKKKRNQGNKRKRN